MQELRSSRTEPSPNNAETAQNRERAAGANESPIPNRESREARLQDLLLAAFRCCSRPTAEKSKLQHGIRLSLDTGRRR